MVLVAVAVVEEIAIAREVEEDPIEVVQLDGEEVDADDERSVAHSLIPGNHNQRLSACKILVMTSMKMTWKKFCLKLDRSHQS